MATPKEVLRHEAPTKNFLCPLSANEYGIEFLSFVIQDYDSKLTIFEVSRDRPLPIDFSMHDAMDPDSLRKINYELSEDFLRLPNISTTLVFSGEKASAKAESKGAAGAKAEAKGAKSSGGAGAKAQAKGGGDDELWSKESDYF
ncbi:lipid binding chaperone [Aureococcus anophagefferens]|uniref:Lipid binding chaperone n=1 Tax=Aureococcus anophagefferens TaxID=44056 RepID=A0ABR1G9Y1_AURAN